MGVVTSTIKPLWTPSERRGSPLPPQIKNVLTIARKHPFYSPSHIYPPNPDEIAKIASEAHSPLAENQLLAEFSIIHKDDLYKPILRLLEDDHPENTFRHSTYVSMTGGGGGSSTPLAFLTDIHENRAQRVAIGDLVRRCGLLEKTDCVLSMHTSGKMYRSLDLIGDTVEYAGASILSVGHLASPKELMTFCKNFRPNVLSGDTSQLVQFASYVESTGPSDNLKITKIMHTSEPLTHPQKLYLQSVFAPNNSPLNFISVLASAEIGPFAVSNISLTGEPFEDCTDFIFDSRHIIVEVLPLDFHFDSQHRKYPCTLPYDEVGLLAVTSLQRFRHPLVRYLNGDIGSVHKLPLCAVPLIQEGAEHLRVLRLYGRDLRHSFKWQGEYFEFSGLKRLMSRANWGILRWQIVLGHDVEVPDSECLEIRLMRGTANSKDEMISQEDLVLHLKEYFCVHARNECLFNVRLAVSEEFVRSVTGNKVLMFVDRR
ncbi:hypothetical protein PVAG01_09283 [Phlyctema vagabunda]|uniref:Uncharacterized protein n=1 Tax=Phlyctema vagabunda TaxID=108571 RepID=A0ABR4P7B1_9HELO